MFSLIASTLGLLIAVGTPAPIAASTTTPVSQDDEFARRLSSLVERMERERIDHHIPGFALAVVKDDEVVLARGFGLADVENNRPVEADTIFAIGSSTKAFTATLIGMLQDDGVMSFDDPIIQHLPAFELPIEGPDADGNATVILRDLLSHRTGFTRMTALWGPGHASRELILKTAIKAEPWSGFREEFLYNNVMFLAAGEASAAAANETWEQLIRSRIFEPLGMTSSNLSTAVAQQDERLSLGYVWNEDSESFEKKRMIDLGSIGPAGAINSNVLDMAEWLRLQLGRGEYDGRRLVSEEVIRDTWTSNIQIAENLSYGMGWMIHDDNDGLVIEHGGNIDGFGAQVALMPDAGLGFVLLTNVSATPLQAKSVSIVFDTLIHDPASEAGNTLESGADLGDQFDGFTGKYTANFGPFDNVFFEVLVRNGNLAVDVPGQTIYELKLPDEQGKWYFRLTDTIAVSFEDAENEEFNTLKMHQSGLVFELPREGSEIQAEVPIEEFDRFLGNYRDSAFKEDLEVVVANNRLAVDVPGQMVYELHLPDSEGKRQFRVTNEIAVRFNEDENGSIASVTFYERGEVREAARVRGESEAEALPSMENFLAERGATDRGRLLIEHGTFRSKGTIRLAQSGIEGTYLLEARRTPPAFRMSINLGEFGGSELGSDGTIAWSANPMRGYSESSGDELEQRLRTHPLYFYGDWNTTFDSVILSDRKVTDDQKLLVFQAKWGDLPTYTLLVDETTGQLARMNHRYIEGSIRVAVKNTYSDYREESGIPIWHVMTEENVHSGRMVLTNKEIEVGVELAPDFHLYKGTED